MKRFMMLALLSLAAIVLTGCCMNCCPTCPPIQTCSLTISTGDYVWEDINKNVWGEVYINGQATGQYINYSLPFMKKVTLSVPCNVWVDVYVVDPCGSQSHTEWVYITPGQNSLYFAYW